MTAKATECQAAYKRARTLARKKKEAHVVYYDEDQCRVRVAKLSAWCLWVDTCQVETLTCAALSIHNRHKTRKGKSTN